MRIIHFSDFHLQGGKILRLHKINAEKLLDALRKVNKKKKIDLVVFGGDLIDRGGESFDSPTEGFKTFEEIVLLPIKSELGLTNEQIVIVPGNHDKDVSLLSKDADSLMKSLGTETKLMKFLFSDNSANENMKGMLAYYAFRDAFYNGIAEYYKSETDFASCLKLQIYGKGIGIAMLNTAWGCTAKSGEEVLLGNAQVVEALDTIEDCDIKIAVMHHDISALIEYDRNAVKQPLMSNFDLLLTGHIHGDDSNYLEIPSGSSIIRSGVAGITVNNNDETDEQYKNGFHVIDINIDTPSDVAIVKYIQNSQYDFGVDKAFGEDGTWCPNKRVFLFESLKNWIKRTHQPYIYITNEKVDSYIQVLKNPSNKIVKIVAFSGYGKTRMVYEAFKNLDISKNCYYCNAVNGDVAVILKQFNVRCQKITDGEGLIIIDNCNSELQYRVLQDYDKFNYGHIRLILTSNAVNVRNSEAKIKEIRLERDILRKEVNEYVDDNIPERNSIIRENIKNIADGFPTMALSLVDEFQSENKINIHTVDTLIERMVSHDTGLTAEQQTALQALALFQPLPYKQGTQPHSVYNKIIENSILLPLASTDANYRHTIVNTTIEKCRNTFIEVGMENLNVRPYPLAIWYVNKWFVGCGNQMEELIDYVESLPESDSNLLKECLCKRLEAVDDSPFAKKLVERWAQDKTFLSEKVILSDMGSRLFLAMSHVNPVAIVKGLLEFFDKKDAEWIKSNVQGKVRRCYVNTLEKLCFSKDSFGYGVQLLAKFALAENETWGNNSTGQFIQLFNILLPGTQSNYQERVIALKTLHEKSSLYDELILKAIGTAFKSGSFSRMNGAEKFGFETKLDYYPCSNSEIRSYWYACRDLVLKLLDKDRKYVDVVSKIVEERSYYWLDKVLLYNNLFWPIVNRVVELRGHNWLKLYNNLFRLSLDEDYEKEYEETKTSIKELISILRPNDFSAKLYEAWMTCQMDFHLSDEEIVKKHIEIFEPLADEFVAKHIYQNYDEVEKILCLDFYIDSCFFKRLQHIMNKEEMSAFYSNLLAFVKKRNGNCEGTKLYQTIGELASRKETESFLNDIYQFHYEKLYAELLTKNEDNELSVLRQLEEMVVADQLSIDILPVYLGSLKWLSAEQAVLLLPWFTTYIKDYADDVFSFLQRYRFVIQPLVKENLEIRSVMKKLLLQYPLKREMKLDAYWYSNMVSFIFKCGRDEEFAKCLNAKFMEEKNGILDGKFVNDLYKILLSKDYIDCVWTDFSRAFYDDNYFMFYMNIRNDIGSGFGFGEGFLFKGNDERIKELCLLYPDKVAHRIAELAPCFEYKGDGDDRKVTGFSHIFVWLLDNFADDKTVLEGIHANLHSFSWSGSIIPYHERNIFCFGQLLNHSNSIVRDWAKECLDSEKKELNRELGNEEFDSMHYNL